ncbi:MAG: ATP-binding protein [Candidatus Peribacteraceae bacterium]|nr:ATP-binding protein [Candidatus Peribacteraceae bacterium]MDD5074571.1 ATP-binding protein [Candidatus Peribacteraceae bacterium]
MPTNIPHNEPQNPAPPENSGSDARHAAVSAEQEETLTASLLATFVRIPDEPIEKSQKRFVDEVLLPSLERGPLIDARSVITEIAETLEHELPTAVQAHSWYERASSIVLRTSRLLHTIQRSTGELLGAPSAFAMAEIAHHCPKYLHMQVAPLCKSLAVAIEAGDHSMAEKNCELILAELGGAGMMDANKRYENLLNRYSITDASMLEKFSEAEHGITAPQSYATITGQVERHFHEVIRDVIQVEHHQYQIDFSTNQSEEDQVGNIIPNGGLIVEALSELVTNALKVMEKKKTGSKLLATIILKSDRSVQLMVRDDGPGTDKEDPEELFDPRVTDTQEFGGTGMGLAYLRENLGKYFGGTIRATKNEEDDEPGMTFMCTIPAPKLK